MQAQNTDKATAVHAPNTTQSATHSLKVKTALRAGDWKLASNTNQTVVRSPAAPAD